MRMLRLIGHELVPTLLVLSLFLLVGCGQSAPTRPDLPAATMPEHTETVRQVFVKIDPTLTEDCSIAEGPVSAALEVAQARKKSLQECTGRMRQIRSIEGTPVKSAAAPKPP